MNRLELINEKLVLITENGNSYPCRLWTEKKVKKGQPWEKIWVMTTKEGVEETGRTYLGYEEVIKSIDSIGYYEFETKTEHREGLSHGGWKSKLTEEEKTILEQAEQTIENLKKLASERERPQMTEEEKLVRELEKVQARLQRIRDEKQNQNQ